MRVIPSGLGRHAASLLPHSASKTRVNALMGEKDRIRGFGSWSFFSNFRTPSPQPSPLWGEGALCASFCGLAWQAFSFSQCFSAPEFFLRANARWQNTVTSITKPIRSKERAVGAVQPDQIIG